MELQKMMAKQEWKAFRKVEKAWGFSKNIVEDLVGLVEFLYDKQIDNLRLAITIANLTMDTKREKDAQILLAFISSAAKNKAQRHGETFKQNKQHDDLAKYVAFTQVSNVLEHVRNTMNAAEQELISYSAEQGHFAEFKQRYIRNLGMELPQDSVDFELRVAYERLSGQWSELNQELNIKVEIAKNAIKTLETLLKNDVNYVELSKKISDIKDNYSEEGLDNECDLAIKRAQGEDPAELDKIRARKDSFRMEVFQGEMEAVLQKKKVYIKQAYNAFLVQFGLEVDANNSQLIRQVPLKNSLIEKNKKPQMGDVITKIQAKKTETKTLKGEVEAPQGGDGGQSMGQ